MLDRTRWNLKFTFFVALSSLGACVSHQHQPEPDQLISSENCEIVNGRYIVRSASDGDILASAVFDSEETISTLVIEKSDSGVVFHGGLDSEQELAREIPERHSCRNSVLTVVLDDQAASGGLAMQASDKKLEMFATDENLLSLRFIDAALTFIFIIPAYQSEDYIVILERTAKPFTE